MTIQRAEVGGDEYLINNYNGLMEADKCISGTDHDKLSSIIITNAVIFGLSVSGDQTILNQKVYKQSLAVAKL